MAGRRRGLHFVGQEWPVTWFLLPLFLLGVGVESLTAQECPSGLARDDSKIMAALARMRPVLDTAFIRGTLHVGLRRRGDGLEARVSHGRADSTAAEPVCRFAFLWTSRGDSLIAVWESLLPTKPASSAAAEYNSWTILDKPRPVPYTSRAAVLAPHVARALVESYHRSAGPITEPTTTELLLVVDSAGRGAITRIAKSSGVPRLDEAALRLATEVSYAPARNRGAPVAAWFVMHVKWHPRGDSLELRCC